jgi:hypothetical protein
MPGDAERPPSFVCWQELDRIADEAADIDAIVRRELSGGVIRTDVAPLIEMTRKVWPRRRRWPARVLILASLVGLGAVVATNGGQDHPGATALRATPAVALSTAASASPSLSAAPTRPPRAITTQLVFSAPCWVLAVTDGQTVLRETLSSGRHTIRAHHTLELTLGNAGGVGLLVNGKAVSTEGSTREVVHLSFALRHGEVVTS